MCRPMTIGIVVVSLVVTTVACAQTPAATQTTANSGGTPGSWVQAALTGYKANGTQQSSSQSTTPTNNSTAVGTQSSGTTTGTNAGLTTLSDLASLLGIGTTSTGTGSTGITSQHHRFRKELELALLDAFFTAVTSNGQSQNPITSFINALRPLILPPSSSASTTGTGTSSATNSNGTSTNGA